MKDITVVMVTVDRSPKPNYLEETLTNLHRSGVFHSDRLESFHLVDSGSEDEMFVESQIPKMIRDKIMCWGTEQSRCANLNVSAALKVGAERCKPWVLFLEDDIDVCDRFLDGVGTWLDKNEHPHRYVYLFGSHWSRGNIDWSEVPLDKFYATQAFAMRSIDAIDFSEYLFENPFAQNSEGHGYDILMTHWSKANWPDVHCFQVSNPSFVQHIGMDSVINPRDDVHTFPSWPGRYWSYES